MLFPARPSYFEKYAGRGLPVMIDTILVTRIRNAAGSTSGVAKKDFEAAQKRIADLEEKHKKQNGKISELEQRVTALKKGKPTPEEQAERRKNVICNFCKKKGHYASECPEKDDKDGE